MQRSYYILILDPLIRRFNALAVKNIKQPEQIDDGREPECFLNTLGDQRKSCWIPVGKNYTTIILGLKRNHERVLSSAIVSDRVVWKNK